MQVLPFPHHPAFSIAAIDRYIRADRLFSGDFQQTVRATDQPRLELTEPAVICRYGERKIFINAPVIEVLAAQCPPQTYLRALFIEIEQPLDLELLQLAYGDLGQMRLWRSPKNRPGHNRKNPPIRSRTGAGRSPDVYPTYCKQALIRLRESSSLREHLATRVFGKSPPDVSQRDYEELVNFQIGRDAIRTIMGRFEAKLLGTETGGAHG